MKQAVILSIQGRQRYQDQEPEIIELVTEGVMEFHNGGWDITYEESELTGLAGVTTTFRVEPGKVILTRQGALKSQMVFQEGVSHDSLYQMPFGASGFFAVGDSNISLEQFCGLFLTGGWTTVT